MKDHDGGNVVGEREAGRGRGTGMRMVRERAVRGQETEAGNGDGRQGHQGGFGEDT